MLKNWRERWYDGEKWGKVMVISLILFFVYLGDAILSDWVPGFIQDKMGGSLVMGLIVSFSSLVGFGADLAFPQLLRGISGNRMLLFAIGSSLMFAGVLFWTTSWPGVLLFLLAMGIWGIYYEFLGFGSQLFVAQSVETKMRSGVWAFLGVFKSLAYFLGPVIGSSVDVQAGDRSVIAVAAACVGLGYVTWKILGRRISGKAIEQPKTRTVNLVQELASWRVLSVALWPVLILSLTMGMIDATFWTTGAVFSDILAKSNWWGSWFLPLYSLPSVFVGLVLMKLGIYKGKKKIAEIFLLMGGIGLLLLSISSELWLTLAVALFCGVVLAVSYPLVEAVYSDVVVRMGTHRKHLVGMASSTWSVAYIVAPVTSGWISQMVGERMTFVFFGVWVTMIALILLVVTPRKMKVPLQKIAKIDLSGTR